MREVGPNAAQSLSQGGVGHSPLMDDDILKTSEASNFIHAGKVVDIDRRLQMPRFHSGGFHKEKMPLKTYNNVAKAATDDVGVSHASNYTHTSRP
ncbi:hypothetical protein GOP47_0005064 [Adiantum capillus-veneris]|uniref:Uncharacterized protein n=1 Tax=Adiantum capillus-veneris TaxID=13818 RepID=A0A9D4ZNT5_ADICA|nr:hypothetical protein GOP47_0005064 [Adiantum capillus-veneris]